MKNHIIYIYIFFIGSYTDRKKEKETIDEDEEGKEKKIHQEKKKVSKL